MPIDEAVRATGIGGTDIAAILGCDERRDAFSVWKQKRGELEREPPTPRMLLGKAFERGILQYYADLTGRELRYVDETLRHPSRPWMVYTPDALCIHEPRGVDAKFVSWDQRFRWGATADDIPAYIQAQAWWYMAATDLPVWDIAAVTSDGDPLFYTVERDGRIEAVMLAAAEEFYTRYLIGDETPALGASPETARWLKQAFPRHTAPKPRPATEPEVALLEEYAQARAEAKQTATEKTARENAIKFAIGDGAGLAWEHGVFTWKATKDTRNVRWEDLARGELVRSQRMPQLEFDELVKQYTDLRPGARRVYFRYDGAEADDE
jgi:predicted phage-related endonuclease